MKLSARMIRASLWVALPLALAGCGEYAGDLSGPAEFRVRNTLSQTRSAQEDFSFEFSQTVYPLLRAYCVDCHGGTGPGSPQIAHPDPAAAYYAVLANQKVSLSNPITSRLVQRLSSDLHHCWSNCIVDGAVMNEAIELWASMMGTAAIGTATDEVISSDRRMLADGVIEEQEARVENGLILLYDFKEGSGDRVTDQSGDFPTIDLDIEGDDVEWMSSYGLRFESGRAVSAAGGSTQKLYRRIADPVTGSQAYTVEAWIANADTTQEGPARIVTYSRNSNSRNFTLGQVLYQYDFRNRNTNPRISNNGTPELRTYDVDRDAQATLQHVIMTYDQFTGRRIYVDGIWTDDVDEEVPDRLWNWDRTYRFSLGDEPGGGRQWRGAIQHVAVYDRVLSQVEITQNYDAGVGKKVKVRFDVGDWTGQESYIDFVVSEFDDYSYLFCEPTFVSASPGGMRVKNIRIQVNDTIPVSGQAFQTLDANVVAASQQLSRQCSIIPKEFGSGADEFSIVFEALDDLINVAEDNFPATNIGIIDDSIMPVEGFRTFAQINDTMSIVTGVDTSVANVEDTYLDLKQQLPSSPDLRTFVSTHQIGISKLSLEYCDALVESSTLRTDFFGSFEFDSPTTAAFSDDTKIDAIIVPLTEKMVDPSLVNQPNLAEIRPVLYDLITDLTAGCDASCDADFTQNVVKGACAAVLGSATMSIF